MFNLMSKGAIPSEEDMEAAREPQDGTPFPRRVRRHMQAIHSLTASFIPPWGNRLTLAL